MRVRKRHGYLPDCHFVITLAKITKNFGHWGQVLTPISPLGYAPDLTSLGSFVIVSIKGTLPQKSVWALTVQFSEKTTMVPFIWM